MQNQRMLNPGVSALVLIGLLCAALVATALAVPTSLRSPYVGASEDERLLRAAEPREERSGIWRHYEIVY
jgi:hypothetical protein